MRYGVTATVGIMTYSKGQLLSRRVRQIPYFEVTAYCHERASEMAFDIVNPAGLRTDESKHLGYEFSVTVVELSKE